MSEQQDQRLLCPGCSHNIQGQDPRPDAFRYLTIDEMVTAGYRCQNNSCFVCIEEDKIFTKDMNTVSDHTAVPITSSNKPPVTPVNTQNKDIIITTDNGTGPSGQVSTPSAIAVLSSQPNLRGTIRNCWTEYEIDLLVEMKTRGHSWVQISEVGYLSQVVMGRRELMFIQKLPRHTLRSVESKWAVLKS
ncbi:hypothetical protein VMCG_08599 [Cytospora schulzeri]|uniref:Uncharacterized protein n=1 Tax=Cytospora schulzeri TaxID=448051 RepID=A0A423VVV1_9PEZI|nr:hypothetical protein VMCG_08599 [Valsa malicola]